MMYVKTDFNLNCKLPNKRRLVSSARVTFNYAKFYLDIILMLKN